MFKLNKDDLMVFFLNSTNMLFSGFCLNTISSRLILIVLFTV